MPESFRFTPKTEPFPLTATSISLADRGVTTLQREIGSFTRCKMLSLQKNKLKRLPDEIGNMKALEDLNLSENPLTELPSSLAKCTKLRKLLVSKTKIEQFPPLPQVRILMATHLTPAAVRSLCSMTQLEALHISNCGLTELPPEIGNLKHLEFLSIVSNKLKKLPDSLAGLKKLVDVHCVSNKLSKAEEDRMAKLMPHTSWDWRFLR